MTDGPPEKLTLSITSGYNVPWAKNLAPPTAAELLCIGYTGLQIIFVSKEDAPKPYETERMVRIALISGANVGTG